MKYTSEPSTTDNLKITWSVLFPVRWCNQLKNVLKAVTPERIENNLIPEDDNKSMQKIIVRMLIDKEYRLAADNTDFTHTDRGAFSKYYNYSEEQSAQISRYKTVKDHIIHEAKNGKWKFETLPFNKSLKKNISSLFEILRKQIPDPSQKKDINKTKKILLEDMEEHTSNLIKKFHTLTYLPDQYKTNEYKESLLAKDLESRLTFLTAIASTWHYWYHSEQDTIDLSLLVLPPTSLEDNSNSEDNSWRKLFKTKGEEATALLKNIRNDINSNQDYSSASKKCVSFLKHYLNFAKELEIGEVYYHLAISCADHGYEKENYNYKELLAQAVEYGYMDARDRLYRETGQAYHVPLLPPVSDTSGTAKIIFNTQNMYTEEFGKTLPSELQNDECRDDMIITASTKEALENAVQKNQDCRFLLLDDSFSKNFQDLLYILNKILVCNQNENTSDSLILSRLWDRTTIYIRTAEDKYSALIDTALKRLGNFTIKIFTLDDSKWSAQYLLNRHPLFKPIAFSSQDDLITSPVTIHFTIISQGNIDLTTWLIREAFWLGCFHYSNVTLAINLISPDCSTIESQLHFDCPDMFDDLPDSELVSKVKPLYKRYPIDSLSSPKLIEALNDLNNLPNAYHFYVINTDSDIDNLNYSIKIREWSIQTLVSSEKKLQKNTLPDIAFYCKNSEIAHLSKNIVVQTVDSGNQWYNNYNLIPFGMLCDRYSWNEIDGGYLEKVAQSTHLQYCGVKPTDSDDTKTIHLKDYFSRCYNRDSSMAVALSMPYRLFQTTCESSDHILSDEQIPELVSAEMKRRNIKKMAEVFKVSIEDSETGLMNKILLLQYEHSRWLRWAISRGWKKATIDEVLNYMRAGNPKQQLHIARLHGCICSLDDLEVLSKRMCSYAETTSGNDWKRYASERIAHYVDAGDGKRSYVSFYEYVPRNFTAIDESNIEATSEIITTAWFPDENEEDK